MGHDFSNGMRAGNPPIRELGRESFEGARGGKEANRLGEQLTCVHGGESYHAVTGSRVRGSRVRFSDAC